MKVLREIIENSNSRWVESNSSFIYTSSLFHGGSNIIDLGFLLGNLIYGNLGFNGVFSDLEEGRRRKEKKQWQQRNHAQPSTAQHHAQHRAIGCTTLCAAASRMQRRPLPYIAQCRPRYRHATPVPCLARSR